MNFQLPAAQRRWSTAEGVAIVEEQWGTYPRRREIESLVQRLIADVPKRSILDLGCGTARYSEVLGGWARYVGVDSSVPMLALAAQRLGDQLPGASNLVTGNVLRWRTAEQFDLALCLEVSPHYADPLGFLRTILASFDAKHILVSVEAHSRPSGGTIDFKVGWDGDKTGANLGSRSVAEADMAVFFRDYDVVAMERVGSAWHPDAVDWFVLVRLAR